MSLVMKMFISLMLILFWIFISILVKKIPDKVFYREKVGYKVNKELYIKKGRSTINLLIIGNIIISTFMWVGNEFILVLLSCQPLALFVLLQDKTDII